MIEFTLQGGICDGLKVGWGLHEENGWGFIALGAMPRNVRSGPQVRVEEQTGSSVLSKLDGKDYLLLFGHRHEKGKIVDVMYRASVVGDAIECSYCGEEP